MLKNYRAIIIFVMELLLWRKRLCQKPDIFTTENPAFNWHLKMKMSPFIKITGRDKFQNGCGEMHIKMNGLINIAKENGPKIDEAALQRFLGEIVWFPTAALSPYIQWEAIDSLTARATMSYKGTTGSGTFTFNEKGAPVSISAMRYKDNTADAEKKLWINEVKATKRFHGINVPVRTETTWKLDPGDWKWLQIEIDDIDYNISSSM